ncbi:MAG: ParB N-terminal domain-containing protein, partial [Rubellimicrobium sp.]|nr:ParB N-terminal domain-containing protein [Rubellimicrobium sp.]
ARRRLGPALGGPFPLSEEGASPPPARPPVAHVAGEAAVRAALDEVTGTLRMAEEEGRLVLSLPLAEVAEGHLIRDRLAATPEAMAELTESLRRRGQQMPIEVADLGPGARPRYGLISGWRRLIALRALAEETGEARFATVLALVRRAGGGAEAYVAMVEENEIRADLSFYERARIVLRAVEAGVFADDRAARRALFASALPAKRSKIRSFQPIVTALDPVLRFPARISEKAGLALSAAMAADPGLASALVAALSATPAPSAEVEAGIIRQVMRARFSAQETGSEPAHRVDSVSEGLRLSGGPGRVTLSGSAVTAEFVESLSAWVQSWRDGTAR